MKKLVGIISSPTRATRAIVMDDLCRQDMISRTKATDAAIRR